MIQRGRIAALVFALLFGVAAVFTLRNTDILAMLLDRSDSQTADSDLTDASTRDETGRGTISYLLDDERWTTFALPGRLSGLRLLSHPDVAATHLPEAGETFRYGFEIEILDQDGTLLRHQQPFFRTELVTYRDSVDGAEVTARRYSDDPALPLAVDRLILDLKDLPQASLVRMRTLSLDPQLIGVNLRVYRPRPYNESNVSALWERLPITEKRALSVGFVYPPDLLTRDEREAILSHRWQPFGPVGIEGRDYVSRRLEIYDPPGGRVVAAESTLADGVYLDANRQAGFALPETFSGLHVTASSPDMLLAEAGLQVAPITIEAEVESPFSIESERISIRTDDTGTARLDPPGGGRFILSAAEPLWVRIAAELPNGSLRILTDEVARTRYQFFDRDAPLSIATRPNLGQALPLRVDLRIFGDATQAIELRMLNDAGRLIAEERLELAVAPSLYDRVVDAPESPLSEIRRVYLMLGPEVARIEIAADGPALAAAYMQPVALPRVIDVPEDYFARSASRGDNRSWFGVKAKRRDGSAARDVLIERPLRAADRTAVADLDTLEWEEFVPEGDWAARRALVPREATGLNDQSRRIFFQPVRTRRPLTLATVAGDFQPELILPADAPSGRYTALIDGKPFWEAELSANMRVSLPRLRPGSRELQLLGPEDGTDVLVSGIMAKTPGYIERRLLRLAPGTVSFDIRKRSAGREVLTIRTFAQEESLERAELTVALDAKRPRNTLLRDWSDTARRFNIRLTGGDRRAILEQSGRVLGSEQRMFLVLGEDIPEGVYRITMSLEHDTELLVLISRAFSNVGGQIEFVYEDLEATE